MSWRWAGYLARERAAECREEADRLAVDEGRADAFRKYLQSYGDAKALVAWCKRRQAQHLEEFGGLCDGRKDTDITVSERAPKKDPDDA